MINKERVLFERIKEDDYRALSEMYKIYYTDFLKFFSSHNVPKEEIKDIYQETMVAFYQNVVQKKITECPNSLKGYLLGIGKHKMIDYFNKRNKNLKLSSSGHEVVSIALEENSLSEEEKLLHKHFKKLGESCKNIIHLYYYRGFTIKEITEFGNYKNENTVKSHKSRCLKKLRDLINGEE